MSFHFRFLFSLWSKLGRKSRRRKRADVLKVKCPTCPNTYVTSQEELALHLECHSEDVCGDRIFRCPECPKVCKIWLNMVRHMGQHRDISTFRKLPADCYKCKHCLKDFKVPECLREHVRVVHEGQKRFECHICHEKFKVYKTKMRHMDIKHANITYTCDVCPYSTKVRRNLKQHADAHEKKKQKVKAGSDENRSDEAAPGPAQFTVSHSGPIFFGTDESDHLEGPSDASHASVSGQLGFLRPMFPTPHELVPDSSTPSTSSLSLVSRAHFEQPLQLPLTSLPPGPSQSIVYLSATGNLISSTHNPASGQLQPGLFTLQLAGSALPGFSAVQFPEQQVFST
ncbi:hypothetical protein BV898_10249 [Hypsibius exemplaris]|uniref:C2H2-type domain-containing protein n=1 Tax=Hypsibius exemplaris TaxID=2072580 RepID=A0A1W0WKG6_HYPEX|nr:hypothetical protein BV898_10249 [Hypsibius exemplaris]